MVICLNMVEALLEHSKMVISMDDWVLSISIMMVISDMVSIGQANRVCQLVTLWLSHSLLNRMVNWLKTV